MVQNAPEQPAESPAPQSSMLQPQSSSPASTQQHATIQDVARQVGVSVSTVSRSFTRPNLVSKRTRQRVLTAARKLDFSISRSAMALKSGHSFRIALLLPSPLDEWFNVKVYEGLAAVVSRAGYDLSVFTISDNATRRDFFTNMPVRRNADAVVLCSFNTRRDELGLLRGMGVPVVGINTYSTIGLDAAVSINDAASAQIATRHLIGLGHRRLAYIYTRHPTPFHFSADNRHRGFQEAIKQSGKDIQQNLISCPLDYDPVNAALTQLLELDPQPTALFFQTDDVAIPVMYRLRRYGKEIPRDYSVIGFDDSTYSAQIGLTTMHQDPTQLGALAGQKILDLLDGKKLEHPFEHPLATLVLRDTTAQPHTDEVQD